MTAKPMRPLLAVLGLAGTLSVAAQDAPSHGRPFFMPEAERARIRQVIGDNEWAKAEYARVREAATADGHLAAFLYALDGEAAHLPLARQWLLARYGREAYATRTAAAHLADPDYFKGGQGGIPSVYYETDFTGLIGFDWVHDGLDGAARGEIRDGIVTQARYKLRCMDRWTQTPNLVFKPTCYVALAGLVTQEPELIQWGFHRKPGSPIGGYFSVLDVMLADGGPWREAPIYAVAHETIRCLAIVSRLRSLYDGHDWWRHKGAGGGSPAGLMDYYLDTAYPIESTGHGPGQVRVATYGDGATGPGGDLFLANPAGKALDMAAALTAAYAASGGEPRYAPFVAMIPDYQPDLFDRFPLPPTPAFPPAPSKVWPTYGLAILRADESPDSWTRDAPVVIQLLGQGYGHDHRDKFAIAFHGAGRLLYPDYNAIQYENPSIGWTRNTIAHSTLMVDEGDTRNTTPTAVRHDFTPEAKYLATSAVGVYEGVGQTRVLLLTREYLLDLFAATSAVPHTYDYLLHSFGQPRPVRLPPLEPTVALDRRFFLLDDKRAAATDDAWALDFVVKDGSDRREGRFTDAWYAHTAAVRVTMAGVPGTLVATGRWGARLAELVSGRQKDAALDRLGSLVVRRAGVRDTLFAGVHEPYSGAATPVVSSVNVVAWSRDAVVVRVEAAGFTDYVAATFGPQAEAPEHALASAVTPVAEFAFRNYGYLRLNRDGTAVARGGWTGFGLPGVARTLVLNGRPVKVESRDGAVVFGQVPPTPAAEFPAEPDRASPLAVAPVVVRLAKHDRRGLTLTLTNRLDRPVSGRLRCAAPEGLTLEPAEPAFSPLAAGASAAVPVTVVCDRPGAGGTEVHEFSAHAPGTIETTGGDGRHTLPLEVVTAGADGREATGPAAPLVVIVGPTLECAYRHPSPNVYRVSAPRYTAEFDMLHGLCRHLADDDGVPRLDGTPLFTFSDGEKDLLSEATANAFTWATETPARLVAQAEDRCRYQVACDDDRITIRMDAGWTQFERTHFTVPGQWLSPRGAPAWARVVAVGDGGAEADAQPGTPLKVAAAELAFPGARWHLAFLFEPPQRVRFDGAAIRFDIGSLTGDSWSVGFCRPGGLEAWRQAGAE